MLKISGLRKSYFAEGRNFEALKGISLDVPTGKLLTLLGPSGCGKSTTLRSIAGLETPDEGRITIGQSDVFCSARGISLPSNRRQVGMVFQSYAIWPHMTVFQNIAYPLVAAKMPKVEIRKKVESVAELVGLHGLLERSAPLLSGGQQQRVALARALVGEPDVLLLDEPLSNLDAQLREQMRTEIRALQQRVGLTAVYVTHDQQEALAISDLIVLMNGGQLIEWGTPRDVYAKPKSRFGAEFIGAANVIPVTNTKPCGAVVTADTAWGKITYRCDGAAARSVVIRPEDIHLHCDGGDIVANVWRARVESVVFLGSICDCRLTVGSTTLRAHLPQRTVLEVGRDVLIRVDETCCIPLAE